MGFLVNVPKEEHNDISARSMNIDDRRPITDYRPHIFGKFHLDQIKDGGWRSF